MNASDSSRNMMRLKRGEAPTLQLVVFGAHIVGVADEFVVAATEKFTLTNSSLFLAFARARSVIHQHPLLPCLPGAPMRFERQCKVGQWRRDAGSEGQQHPFECRPRCGQRHANVDAGLP